MSPQDGTGGVDALASSLLSAAECMARALTARDGLEAALAGESCDVAVDKALEAVWHRRELQKTFGEDGPRSSQHVQECLDSLEQWWTSRVSNLPRHSGDAGWDSLRTGLLKLVLMPEIDDPAASAAARSLPMFLDRALQRAEALAENPLGHGYVPTSNRDVLDQQLGELRRHESHLYVLELLFWHLNIGYSCPNDSTWSQLFESMVSMVGDESKKESLISFHSLADDLRCLLETVRTARAALPEAVRSGDFRFLDELLDGGHKSRIPERLNLHRQLEIERQKVEEAKARREAVRRCVNEFVWCLQHQRVEDARRLAPRPAVTVPVRAPRGELCGDLVGREWAACMVGLDRRETRCPLNCLSLLEMARDRLEKWQREDPEDDCGLCPGAAHRLGVISPADPLGWECRLTLETAVLPPLLGEISAFREWLAVLIGEPKMPSSGPSVRSQRDESEHEAGLAFHKGTPPNLRNDLSTWRDTMGEADEDRRKGDFDSAGRRIREAIGLLQELAAALRRPPKHSVLTGMAHMLQEHSKGLAEGWVDPEIQLAEKGLRSEIQDVNRPLEDDEPSLYGLRKLKEMEGQWKIRWSKYCQSVQQLRTLESKFVINRLFGGASREEQKRTACWALYHRCEAICPEYPELKMQAEYLGIEWTPKGPHIWKLWPDESVKGYDEC